MTHIRTTVRLNHNKAIFYSRVACIIMSVVFIVLSVGSRGRAIGRHDRGFRSRESSDVRVCTQ